MFPTLIVSVSPGLCDSIAELRRKIQTVGADHVLFLDEVPFKLSEAPSHTVVLPGESAYVEVDDNSSYAPRYDMVACCTHMEVFPSTFFGPDKRAALGVRGITQKMFIKYIQDILAQACGSLDRYPLYLVLDKASIHKEEKILEAFHDNGCQELVEVWKMPTKAGKRMSPLDNALFHHWKERIRGLGKVSKVNAIQRMSDEWNNLPSTLLRSQYRHCGLVRWELPYFDCPQPSVHKHSS
jgi:DDE superfamily endonuclease